METKLCPEVISGLKRMGNSTLVSDEMFSNLLICGTRSITQCALMSVDVSSLLTAVSKGDVMKEAHYAFINLLVEAARLDSPFDSLFTYLETKLNWPKTRCQKLCDAYVEALPKLQAILSNIGLHPPHVVDVTWNLKQSIKSSSNEHASSLIVAVELETEGLLDSQKNVKFNCTLSELQDMASKLKEAFRQIERVAQINNS